MSSESYIERENCKFAEDNYDYICIKLTSANSINGLPDRLFIGFNESIFFIEYKAPDEEPRKLQKFYIKLLKTMGFTVYVVDSKIQGEKIIKKEYEKSLV